MHSFSKKYLFMNWSVYEMYMHPIQSCYNLCPVLVGTCNSEIYLSRCPVINWNGRNNLREIYSFRRGISISSSKGYVLNELHLF